jgi:RNA polymerase sigma factor (sigma-70 family)
MQASGGHDPRSDEELAARAAAGDQAAFAAIYERYFAGIYDFALRTVREPDVAADVVRNTFARAWDRMRKAHGKRNRIAFGSARIYSLARASAIAELQRGPRRDIADQQSPETNGAVPFAQPDSSRLAGEQPDPEEQETAEVVWDCATAFSPKQYTLLDMHLRRGLRADELAEVLRYDENAIYIMLYRLREALVRSAARTLLLGRGRSECREFDVLLAEVGTERRKSGRAIDGHLKLCARCQAAARRYPSPLKVFAGLAWVEPGAGVQAAVRRDVLAYASGLLAHRPSRRLQPPGGLLARPEAAAARPRAPLIAAAGAATLCIIAILVAGVLIFGTGGGGAATVRDPDDVRSTNSKIGEPSADRTIDLTWTAIPGVKAYSVMWSHGAEDLPDEVADLSGDATGATSPELEPGTWYFHLRTQGNDGTWTSTLHLGPFEVTGGSPTPNATMTPSPAPTKTATPPPAPRFPTQEPPAPTETAQPTLAPTATPAPTPVPTATATPKPTDTPIITASPAETP